MRLFLAGPPDTGRLRPIAAARDALTRRDAVLIYTSGVRHRALVLKIGRSLLEAGYAVAFLSKLSPRHRGTRVLVGKALGCPVLYFPNAHAVLRGARVRAPARNWPLMVQYLPAYMGGYVRAMRPRAMHAMSVASIGEKYRGRQGAWRGPGYPPSGQTLAPTPLPPDWSALRARRDPRRRQAWPPAYWRPSRA